MLGSVQFYVADEILKIESIIYFTYYTDASVTSGFGSVVSFKGRTVYMIWFGLSAP